MPQKVERWRPRRMRASVHKETEHYRTSDWAAKRERILVRDAFVCAACGRVVSGKEAHVDHVVPLEEGGADDDANLQVLCAADHGRKTRAEQRRRGLG